MRRYSSASKSRASAKRALCFAAWLNACDGWAGSERPSRSSLMVLLCEGF